METQNNSYKIYDNSDLGTVNISDNVLAVVSAMAAMEVEGVCSMSGDITSEIVSKIGIKKLSKGVRVDVTDNGVSVKLSIVIRMNENILNISKKVQDKVKNTVENMTGMVVTDVNVNIASVASN